MRDAALRLLICPMCRTAFTLRESERAADSHVMTGALTCAGGKHTYPIAGGVPRLIPGTVHAEATETAARFGASWKEFDHLREYDEQWLTNWLRPVGPDEFRGKVVFEGGCGKGRHTVIAAERWGVKELVALDLGEAVDVAFAHSRHLANVHVVQGDLLQPPVGRVFDLAFSVGVLHHLPEPRAGFESICKVVRPGGRVAFWVYGYESNEWIVKYVNPIRERVTAKMPTSALYWLLLPPSAMLAAAMQLYKVEPLAEKLPYRAYMKVFSRLPLREVHGIVFDQMVTPLAFYLREDEVRSWLARPGLKDVQLAWHNENSWRGCATVTE